MVIVYVTNEGDLQHEDTPRPDTLKDNENNAGNNKEYKIQRFDVETKKHLITTIQIYSDTNEKEVTNIGSEVGEVTYIQDRIPNNLLIDLLKNRNWIQNGDIITYILDNDKLWYIYIKRSRHKQQKRYRKGNIYLIN